MDNHKINLTIDRSIAKAFDDYCYAVGLTKSKVLRQWLELPNLSLELNNVRPIKAETGVQYSFFIDTTANQKLISISTTLGITRSNLLRLIIYARLAQTSPSTMYISGKEPSQLWMKGELPQLISLLEQNKYNLPVEQSILLIKAYIEQGQLDGANDLLDLLESSLSLSQLNSIKPRLILLRIDICFITKKLDLGEQMLKLLSLRMGEIQDREVIGMIYFQQGLLASYWEDFAEALELWEKAMQYLDIQHHPLQYCLIYLRMARYWSYQFDFNNTNKYLQMSEMISELIPNLRYRGITISEKAYSHYLQSHINQSNALLEKSGHIYSKLNSYRGIHFSNNMYSKIAILEDDYSEASDYINKSVDVYQNSINSQLVDHAKMLQLVISAKSNYKSANQQLQLMKTMPTKLSRASTLNYVHAAVQYVNNANVKDSRIGEIALKQLSDKAPYPLLQKVALSTLQTKRIQVIY